MQGLLGFNNIIMRESHMFIFYTAEGEANLVHYDLVLVSQTSILKLDIGYTYLFDCSSL